MARPVKTWDIAIELDPSAAEPLFLQIARGISADIQCGRLLAGTRLPGSRSLAATLSVHRNTVVAAYEELLAEGWLESSQASGTFVADILPPSVPEKRNNSPRRLRQPGYELPERSTGLPTDTPNRDELLPMGDGVCDPRLLSVTEFGRKYRRILETHRLEVLSYGNAQGHPRLRQALSEMLNTARGLDTDSSHVLVTQGTQMALDLVARALISPGDVVIVEALGYRPAWAAFQQYGAKLVPVRVDAQGIDTDRIKAIAAKHRVRAVYTTPHHQYPTTVIMNPARRMALLELAQQHRFAIVEDDYDHEYHYEGRPVLPMASRDAHGVVIYLGTLAKLLAPGIRLGFVAAPAAVIELLTAHRLIVDRQGDHPLQMTVAELLDDGTIPRHARRARRIYQTRRDHVVKALRKQLGGAITFNVPQGGMALWAEVSGDINVEAWARSAVEHGVAIRTGGSLAFDGRYRPNIRLGFAALDEGELDTAVHRLAKALANTPKN